MTVTIEVLSPADLREPDLGAWRALQAAHPHLASPFLTPDWTLALDPLGGPDHRRNKVVVWREGGAAIGFLPVRKAGVVGCGVGSPFNDDQGLIAAPGAPIRLRDALGALRLGRLDFSHVDARQNAFDGHRRGRCMSWSVDIGQGFEAYAEDRRAAGVDILKDTAKKRRKLEREQGDVVFSALSQDAAAFEQLFAWKSAQLEATHQTDIFRPTWTRALMRRIFETREASFGGAFFTLQAGGKLIASHFALRGPGVLHAWMIAHDEAYARYSPGIILIADILRWAADMGYQRLDLGPGDYRFKTSLSNAPREISHGYVGRPCPASFIREAQYRVRATAEALPLGALSELPGKAMRRVDLLRALG